jgi:ubiquinone/menaquinone biosynthesis C-methylase UbiE
MACLDSSLDTTRCGTGSRSEAAAPPAWIGYDDVAEQYDRFVVPNGYLELAEDLIAALAPGPEALVLDVGTGSGACARALAARQPRAVAIGIDPSVPMLRRAMRAGARPIAAVAPGLPFRDATFDAAAANLVLSHLPRYDVALRDIVRVLKPGGMLGVTAWAGGCRSEGYDVWRETVAQFVSLERLEEATRQALPWEGWFTDAGHLVAALRTAGLDHIMVHRYSRRFSLETTEFLSMQLAFLSARFLRRHLTPARWQAFQEQLAATFERRFGRQVEITNCVHVAVGVKA